MLIREYAAIYTKELYAMYLKSNRMGEVFDVMTNQQSVYLSPTKNPLSLGDFAHEIRQPVFGVYTACNSYKEYQIARKRHANVILPNNVVLLGAYSNYSEDDFKSLMSTGKAEVNNRYDIVPDTLPDSIFNSNMIENIHVSLHDTITILAGGEAPHVAEQDKALILDAKKAYRARESIKGLVTDVEQLKELHRILLRSEEDKCPGQFRKVNVFIRSASHEFPNYTEVPARVEALCDLIKRNEGTEPLVLATLHHAALVNIHPFMDGNGRICRLAVHPFMRVPENKRLEYYMALDAYGYCGSILPMYNLACRIN